MTALDVRASWMRFRQSVSEDVIARKDSQSALFVLFDHYRALPAADRPIIDEFLAEELGSTDETTRFHALALINEFRITAALPALRRLAEWLETRSSPGAPHEWAKVNRIIAALLESKVHDVVSR